MLTASGQSKMMEKLFGAKASHGLYQRHHELDSWFANFVQKVVYDQIWPLGSLPLLTKIAATISVLATLKKQAQLHIHLQSFLRIGGDTNLLIQMFNLLEKKGYIDSASDFIQLLKRVKPDAGGSKAGFSALKPDDRMSSLVELAACLTRGDSDVSKGLMQGLLQKEVLTSGDIRAVLRQIMSYAGCPCSMNGFAWLLEVEKALDIKVLPQESNRELVPLSKMMVALYGEKEAEKVYERCHEVDPWFNGYVQRVIYDEIWALKPLNLIEKSLVTIVTLATLKREEQLQIHLKGYVHLGGHPNELRELFAFFVKENYLSSSQLLESYLDDMDASIKTIDGNSSTSVLTSRNIHIIKLAASIAQGGSKLIVDEHSKDGLTFAEIKAINIQAMTYAGIPRTMGKLAELACTQTETSDAVMPLQCKL